jgi:hypothetical protein
MEPSQLLHFPTLLDSEQRYKRTQLALCFFILRILLRDYMVLGTLQIMVSTGFALHYPTFNSHTWGSAPVSYYLLGLTSIKCNLQELQVL